jgi:hypothetical protein
MTRRKTVISLVILLVIGLHVAPVLYPSEKGTLWPFMRWTMYKNSRGPGPVEAHLRHIVAISSTGRRDTVTPHLLGLSFTVLEQRYLRPMGTGDFSPAPQLIERLNQNRADSVVELRLESVTYIASDTGIARRENPVVTYRADPSGSR